MKRGSFPPYLGLAEGFNLARAIYEQGGGQASYDLMSRLTGNSSSSSTFVKKIGALKLYGLVSEQNSTVTLTDQGSAIAAPISEDSDRLAKKAAFLGVPTFAKLFERHILEQDLGIPLELSADWVIAFKDAAKAAALLFNRSDGKVQILEAPSLELDRQNIRADIQEVTPSQHAAPILTDSLPQAIPKSVGTPLQPVSASGNNTRFELSDGRVAEFSIPFGINARDAQRLKGYLKGLEFIIDSAVVGDEGPES
jgi:hypothetical protein